MSAHYDYDLAVVGAGSAGMAAALAGAALGARTILIEKARLGGENLWSGGVPSKALLKSARVYETIKRAEEFGAHVEATRLVWGAVRMRIAAVRDEIKTLQRKKLGAAGVEIATGTARFADAHTLVVTTRDGGRSVRAKSIILATGSRLSCPEIEGLADSGYITNETLFDLGSMPRSMAIFGADATVCEFAQAFQRFGCKVTIVCSSDRLLPDEDAEISAACHRILEQEGVGIHTGAEALRAGENEKDRWIEYTGTETAHAGQLLIAMDKRPATEDLNLEAAAIQTDDHGLMLDDHLRTTAANVWACGDLTGAYPFAHVAEYQGKLAARNALLASPCAVDYRLVPWITFTDPEVARLGLTEEAATQLFGECNVWRAPFCEVDRAIIDGDAVGFAKFVTTADGRLLGVHIIGPSAGELIHGYASALRDGVSVLELLETVHGYPTLAAIGEGARRR